MSFSDVGKYNSLLFLLISFVPSEKKLREHIAVRQSRKLKGVQLDWPLEKFIEALAAREKTFTLRDCAAELHRYTMLFYATQLYHTRTHTSTLTNGFKLDQELRANRVRTCGHLLRVYRRKEYWEGLLLASNKKKTFEDALFDLGKNKIMNFLGIHTLHHHLAYWTHEYNQKSIRRGCSLPQDEGIRERAFRFRMTRSSSPLILTMCPAVFLKRTPTLFACLQHSTFTPLQSYLRPWSRCWSITHISNFI